MPEPVAYGVQSVKDAIAITWSAALRAGDQTHTLRVESTESPKI